MHARRSTNPGAAPPDARTVSFATCYDLRGLVRQGPRLALLGLLVAALASGLGAGCNRSAEERPAAESAMVADSTTAGERGMATGIFHALLTVGVAVGAPVIGWLGELSGLKTGLLVNAAVMAAALLAAIALSRRRA